MLSVSTREIVAEKTTPLYALIIVCSFVLLLVLSLSLVTLQRSLRTVGLIVSVIILCIFVWIQLILSSDDWTRGGEETTIYPYQQ